MKECSPPTVLAAQCLCGTSHFEIAVQAESFPLAANHCHCDSCRHWTGTLAISAARWPGPLPDVTRLTQYAFSPRVDTYFCPTCGSMMFWHERESELPYVATGTVVDAGQKLEFIYHICLGDTKDGGCGEWLRTANGKVQEQYEKADPGSSDKLPLGWRKQDVNPGKKKEVLRAYCLCKGVDFCVTRPTEESAMEKFDKPNYPASWWLDATKERYTAGICVCDSCRLAAGCELTEWSFVPIINIKLPDGSAVPGCEFGTIKTYRSSDKAVRYFCGRCGANVFFVADDRPELVDVAVGLFDAESGSLAEDWLSWRTEKVSHSEDGLRRGSLTNDLMQAFAKWKQKNSVP